MVSDGMSLGVPTLTEAFSRLVRGRGTAWWQLAARQDVTRGWLDMQSLDSLVTDSAAASSSWGSGSRVWNGAINVLPDGRRLTPIATIAREAGRRVGLVTTTTITHATPAGFAAVSPLRDDEADIAPQYLDRVDVLLGGGRRFFDAAKRPDRRDLAGEFAGAGYRVCASRDELMAASGAPRLLGLFWDGHLPYSIDRAHDPGMAERVPTLAEMTEAALARLAASREGFLLQVEGGRVDHAAHANDAAALLWDQLAFDDAVAQVVAFAESRRDTLVIVTSDHGNANPGLNGTGPNYRDTNTAFATLTQAKASYDVLRQRFAQGADGGRVPSAEWVREVVAASLGVEFSNTEASAVRESLVAAPAGELNRQLANPQGVLGQVLGNYTGIGWTGTSHTADLVPMLALGPGQDRFEGLQPNTEVFRALTELMGRPFTNPSITPEQAARLARTAHRLPERVHWA
jgi:alkaline phosphatase